MNWYKMKNEMKNIIVVLLLLLAVSPLKSQLEFEKLKIKYNKNVASGDRYNALLSAREMLSFSLGTYRDTSVYYAVSLRYVGNGFYDFGELDSAIYYYEKSRECLKINNKRENIEYSNALNNIAMVYLDKGTARDAESYFLEALEISDKIKADFAAYNRLYSNLGSLYHRIGDFANAEKYYSELLRINQIKFGSNSIYCVVPLQDLGSVKIRQRNYQAGLEYYAQMINILSEDKSKNHDKKIGEIYLKMADVMYETNDLRNYLNYFSKSEDLLMESCEPTAFELGLLYDHKGRHYYGNKSLDSADLFLRKSMKIFEFHKDKGGISDAMANLALVAEANEDFSLAEKYYLQSISIKNPVADEIWTYSYSNLINFYNRFSEFEKAANIAKRALLLASKSFGDTSEQVAAIMNNLSICLDGIGLDSLANEILKVSVGLKYHIYGPSSIEYAKGLWNLSFFDIKYRNYNSAEEKLLKSLTIYNKNKIIDCRYFIFESYKGLVELYNSQSDWKSGDKYIIRAKNIEKIKELCKPRDYLDIVDYEIEIKYNLGDYKKAYELLISNFSDFRKITQREFQNRTNEQQREFWLDLQGKMNFYGWMARDLSAYFPGVISLYYEVELLRKYALTNSRIIKSEYFYEKKLALNSYNNYVNEANHYKSNNVNYQKIKIHQGIIDSLEKKLTQTWGSYWEDHSKWNIHLLDVQAQLDNDEAVVDFVKNFDRLENEIYYSAFIYNKSMLQPIIIRLCKIKELDSLIENLDYEKINTYLAKMYDLIWRPLENYISSYRVIYFSPIGELNNLPFRVMISKTSDSNFEYLSDVHELRNFMTLTSLEKSNNEIEINSNKAILIGAVDFNSIDSFESETINFYSLNKNKIKYQGLPFLTGTAREIDIIDSLMVGWEKTVLKGKFATESRVVDEINKSNFNIIHIATHGYCENVIGDDLDFQSGLISDRSFRKNDDDMVRSGIVLSGGNFAWLGIDSLYNLTGSDGLLNSIDISNLELFSNDLVVLSACNTGLGENYGSEGNYGLKRGLKLAGVNNLIVTLWPINDDVSIVFFRSFYNSLVITHNINKSYNIAMSELRTKYPNSPYLWGAFDFIQ